MYGPSLGQVCQQAKQNRRPSWAPSLPIYAVSTRNHLPDGDHYDGAEEPHLLGGDPAEQVGGRILVRKPPCHLLLLLLLEGEEEEDKRKKNGARKTSENEKALLKDNKFAFE